MARSKYIYLVVSNLDTSIVINGCFTVKHEAISFMEKMIKFDPKNYNYNLRLLSTKDGMAYDPILIVTRKELDDGW